ncbi:cytochrome P450 [Amycolatopsis rubida]|uniref:Cytochrome P450 n=1 Tax=Amycolatopsis rubida TaxID=112413 RepID=A0A1I5Z8B1_9PSEU|nr:MULTISPECIES: cytochrome P450 [Amycolatopsis]MYW89917.1 cytochrome P450 [Amycolatopsis rubida]NEC54894.1 cytochrome P450 [Amycolatopsis rubida]OAP25110.1 Cytochrome P450 107B1 [Amycolatopsis sp. M39]SFQ52726.1 Cytochrome P450 [Amycolatopsis rubida]
MTTTHTEPLAYPFNEEAGLALNEAYTAARENAGMIRVQMPHGEAAWLATRYADARLVLGDRRFSRALAQESDEPRMSEYRRPGGILSMDPPDHTRLRTLVAKAFTARRVEELRPRVARLADDLIKELREHGQPADLVDLYALPIPVAVICELLGVPVADRPQFREWSDAALSTTRLTPEESERSREELRAYMAGLIAEHRAQPQDDLMTALIEARDVRDRLTELELVDLCVGILVAGHETTASQIPNFVYALLDQHEHWDRLCADPSLIPAAVEELLRFVPLGAGAGFARYATEDVEVGDVLVRQGEPVLVAIGAANRDRLRFATADQLVLDRGDNHHLGFGHGVHHCLGAPLARLELQEALRALTRELPGLRLAGDIEWKTQMLVRGPRSMPIGW